MPVETKEPEERTVPEAKPKRRATPKPKVTPKAKVTPKSKAKRCVKQVQEKTERNRSKVQCQVKEQKKKEEHARTYRKEYSRVYRQELKEGATLEEASCFTTNTFLSHKT